jgi:dihydrofolate reductase
MRVSLIAAVADNGVIGRDNDLPWHLPGDLRRFKRLTAGHHLVVGRRTWESVGQPLPGRVFLVVTRRPEAERPGVRFVASLAAALDAARAAGDDEAFIAGGHGIYREGLALADRVYLTRVHTAPLGDTVFPDFVASDWELVERDDHPADERNPHPFTFLTYQRRQGGG